MRRICTLLLIAVVGWQTAVAFEPFQPLPQTPPVPENNPLTADKVELGKQLYFDARLSADNRLSCNSCHDLAAGGSDGRTHTVSVGEWRGKRSAPTVWNAAFHNTLYQDGRSPSLEDQVQTHLLDPDIMGMPDAQTVVNRIAAIPGYRKAFARSFGDREPVSYENIARAIATFERTLVTPGGAFDRYLKGDRSALTPAQRRGFETFNEIGCSACHFWVNLAGPQPGLQLESGEGFWELFPNYLGSRYDKQYDLLADKGRYHVTGDELHKHMWRLPTLRNVAVTAPYFHNGSVKTLDEAVQVMAVTQLDRELPRQQVEDIVAFLESLTGPFPVIQPPELPADDGRRKGADR